LGKTAFFLRKNSLKNYFICFCICFNIVWAPRIAEGCRGCFRALPGEIDKINRLGAEIWLFRENLVFCIGFYKAGQAIRGPLVASEGIPKEKQ